MCIRDSVRTAHLSTEDVTNVLEMELFRTALWVGNQCYLRKDGLFQGSSLSAPIVDLVYDDLLEYYEEFQDIENEDSLILRLADDFFVISTSQRQIIDIKNLTLSGFKEYNATVKKQKIITASSQSDNVKVIQFCAVNIFVEKLEVWKESESLNIPNITSLSSNKILWRLSTLFESRLSYGTLDHDLNSLETIINQINYITINIAETFLKAFSENEIDTKMFMKFMEELLTSALGSCSYIDDDDTFESKVCLSILGGFLDTISCKQTKFKAIVEQLNLEIYKHLNILIK